MWELPAAKVWLSLGRLVCMAWMGVPADRLMGLGVDALRWCGGACPVDRLSSHASLGGQGYIYCSFGIKMNRQKREMICPNPC
ncbi:hypothetical protein QBC37DRAFT_423817, partial [Rhypophila decipiens]